MEVRRTKPLNWAAALAHLAMAKYRNEPATDIIPVLVTSLSVKFLVAGIIDFLTMGRVTLLIY